jgi:DNA-binding CsgD family transcriptional regulator
MGVADDIQVHEAPDGGWGVYLLLDGYYADYAAAADAADRHRERLQGAAEPSLTPRERQVLRIAATSISGPEIAVRLGVSRATVKTHLSNIYRKLGVPGRVAAVTEGIRLGLIDQPTPTARFAPGPN